MTQQDPLTQATKAQPGDILQLPVRVVDVKASDHKFFGRHDLITFEVTEASGDLPAGLRFHLRRPHDGTSDLRSNDRKTRKPRATVAALPTPDASMTLPELIAIADARGVDTGPKPTKARVLALLID